MCLLYDGSTRRLTESGFMWFMEKPGIEPATPGLQGIALIHYTTGAMLVHNQINHYDTVGNYLNMLWFIYLFITFLKRGISVKQVLVISLN